MKKIIYFVIAIAFIFMTTKAYALRYSNSNWYTGVGIGYAHIIGLKSDFNNNVSLIDSELPTGASGSASVNVSSFGSNVYIGYNFNKYIALQSGFDYLGSYKYNMNINYLGYYINESDTADVYNIPIQIKATLPVNNIFSVYALIGGNYWFVNESGTESTNIPDVNTNIPSNNAQGFSPAYGIGISYNLPAHNKIKLEYDYYQNLFNSSTTISKSHYDVEYVSLQWQYNF